MEKSLQGLEDTLDALAAGDIAQAVKEINNFRYSFNTKGLQGFLDILPTDDIV